MWIKTVETEQQTQADLSSWQLLSVHEKHSVPAAYMDSNGVTRTKPVPLWPCHTDSLSLSALEQGTCLKFQAEGKYQKLSFFFFSPPSSFFFLERQFMDRRWRLNHRLYYSYKLLTYFSQIIVIPMHPKREIQKFVWHLKHLRNKFNSPCCINRHIEMTSNVC